MPAPSGVYPPASQGGAYLGKEVFMLKGSTGTYVSKVADGMKFQLPASYKPGAYVMRLYVET